MKNRTWALVAIILGASVFSTYSQADQARQSIASHPSAEDEGWSFSGNIDSLHLKKSSAYREWLGDTAYTFGLAGEYYQPSSHLVYGLGLNLLSYDDQAGYSQLTNKGTKSSDASATSFFAEIGTRLWFTPAQDNFVSLHAGYSVVGGSERSITNCSNCYSEKINMDGGAYGTIRLGHRFNAFDLSIHYQKFFAGDFENAFGIKIATNF